MMAKHSACENNFLYPEDRKNSTKTKKYHSIKSCLLALTFFPKFHAVFHETWLRRKEMSKGKVQEKEPKGILEFLFPDSTYGYKLKNSIFLLEFILVA